MNHFDEVTHVYYMDGKPVPSTSEILKLIPVGFELHKWLNEGNLPQKTKSAADFGTSVHDLMDKLTLGESVTYPNTIVKEMCEYGLSVTGEYDISGNEKPLFSEFGFGGKPDLWGVHKKTKVNTVLDYKTNDQPKHKFKLYNVPKYSYQMGSYSLLLLEQEGFEAEDAVLIHLPTKMTYHVDVQEYAKKFLRLLDVYNGEEYKGAIVKDIISIWNCGVDVVGISNITGSDCSTIKEIVLDRKVV